MYFHGGNIADYKNIKYDFSSNINPLGLPESFKKAMIKDIEELTKYPDIKYRKLIKSIEKYMEVSDKHILLGNGAIELIYKIINNSRYKRLYTIAPTFCEYKRAALNSKMDYYEMPWYNEDFSEININIFLKEIKEKSLIVLCNPNNPTGFYINKENMIFIIENLKEKACSLIIDECFIEFTDDYPRTSFVSHIDSYNNLTIIRALTKFYGMPGIRLGYGITGDKSLWERVKECQYPWNINGAAIIAGSVVLEDKEYIEKSKDWIKSEREFLFKGLQDIKYLKPIHSMANFHLVKIKKTKVDAYDLRDALVKNDILIRVPKGFDSLTKDYFRVAVLDREANQALLSSLKSYFKQ